MTRYVVGFMCVLALGVVGCSETRAQVVAVVLPGAVEPVAWVEMAEAVAWGAPWNSS